MILELKKYLLNGIELSKKELKLILLLSDNEFHTREECMEYLKIYTNASFFIIVKKIKNKFFKDFIINKYDFGYKIKTKIFINY